jgi:hypothetical protein
MTAVPELSCYTTNLVAYLEPKNPAIRHRFAESVRLAVRTDANGELTFSHHPRLDTDEVGGLAYCSAPAWELARAALLTELAGRGRVLACADTYHLPWSPSYRSAHAPHWVLLYRQVDGCWFVADHFTALTPAGQQQPYQGWLSDHQLRIALTPMTAVGPELANRDRHALGLPVDLPPYTHYRWLQFTPGWMTDADDWQPDTVTALMGLADAMAERPELLTRHADDLWTASRHFRFQLATQLDSRRINPDQFDTAARAWEELPRALRFAAAAVARGRPRPGVVAQTFARLVQATQSLYLEQESRQ